jgi:hypothetical protein
LAIIHLDLLDVNGLEWDTRLGALSMYQIHQDSSQMEAALMPERQVVPDWFTVP